MTASTSATGRPRILLIEDERGITEPLIYSLKREGYETITAHECA